MKIGYISRMDSSYMHALALPLRQDSKYIVFSDCHRGDGRADDNFLKNELMYLAALRYYYKNGYTYIELGDGDELWENRSIEKIKEMHPHSFAMIEKFRKEDRFYPVYGNHDMVKKETAYSKKHLGGPCYPGILLEDPQKKLFLTHGHQADVMNSTFWKVNRFLVRYLWKGLELLGVPDPTSAAKNNTHKARTEKRLTKWAAQNDVILITGHTHRPMAGKKESPYFNTGSCVHPAGITGMEIEHRCMTLVKWSLGTDGAQAVYVRREALGKKVCIDTRSSNNL